MAVDRALQGGNWTTGRIFWHIILAGFHAPFVRPPHPCARAHSDQRGVMLLIADLEIVDAPKFVFNRLIGI